jgi:hypothetical protein
VLNGREIHDYDQTTLTETRDKPLRGSVCLQNHGHPVRFRNVRIRVENDEPGQSDRPIPSAVPRGEVGGINF